LQAIALSHVNSEDLFVRKLFSQHVSGRDGYGNCCQDELTTGLLGMLKNTNFYQFCFSWLFGYFCKGSKEQFQALGTGCGDITFQGIRALFTLATKWSGS
jgi:hypothetical protein